MEEDTNKLHIVGLSDLWLAWVRPNRLMANAIAEVLSTFFTPEKAVEAAKKALEALSSSGKEDALTEIQGLASQILSILGTEDPEIMTNKDIQRVVSLCKMICSKYMVK